jgi:archaellum biogenesis protein FlaJ (TadC family)
MKSFNGKLLESTAELAAQSGGAALQIPNLPAFHPKDMSQITNLTMGALIVLTITNTLAPKFATGGHNLQLAFYGAIMCITTGLNLLLIPSIAGTLLA